MIRIIYSHETKQIASIVLSMGVTAFNENSLGVIQGEPETLLEQSITLGLDASQIIDFITQNNIQLSYNMTPELKQVIKDRSFGQRLLNEFLSENKVIDLTLEQDLSLLQAFAPIKAMLEIGAINRAKELWLTVPVDGVITQQRYDKYTVMLNDYLDANTI